MDGRNNQKGYPLSAEEVRARRQEEEELGRIAWARSTKTGSNLSARTTADLRALGAQVGAGLKEGLAFADAIVRAAADAATVGMADEFSAGIDTLVSKGGDGNFGERFSRLHSKEEGIDAHNRKHRPIATGVGELGMAALTFKGVAKAGAKVVSKLPSRAKGQVGERMSDARTLLSGDIPVKHGKRLNLEGGGHTFTDHQTVGGKVVEAKLGPTASLTNRQRQAQAELGSRYRYDHWSFEDVGRVGGGAAVGAQQGMGRVSDHLQETPHRPTRR